MIITQKTVFDFGSADSQTLASRYKPAKKYSLDSYDPIIYAKKNILSGKIVGNPDFPDGFNIDYADAPQLINFIPNIESPGVGNTVPQVNLESSDDLRDKSQAIKDIELAAVGKNGSIDSPAKTSPIIAKASMAR